MVPDRSVDVIEYTYINPIPTVSTWDVLAMLLLLLTAGTIAFRRCRLLA
ncbi:MAG: hypothetical protein KJ749_00545 [Planctomycetes bacterium]|nr:hypothetical protein [Planctomycetota bacterium]